MKKVLLFVMIVFACVSHKSLANIDDDTLKTRIVVSEKDVNSNIYKSAEFIKRYGKKVQAPKIDLKQELSALSLIELYNLKYQLIATKGYLFYDPAFRNKFVKFQWYQPIYWDANFKVYLTANEKKYYDKLCKLTEDKFIDIKSKVGKVKSPGFVSIANSSLFTNLPIGLINNNGFFIEKNNYSELFDVYGSNAYEYVPNFVTTDVYMQLLYCYYKNLLTSIENDKLFDVLKTLSIKAYNDIDNLRKKNSNPKLKNILYKDALYFAIASGVLDSSFKPAKDYIKDFKFEKENIEKAGQINRTDKFGDIDFSQFKVRGSYVRTDKLRRYFRANMWYSQVPFNLKDDEDLQSIALISEVISKSKNANDQSIFNLLNKFDVPINLFVGEPDELTVLDCISSVEKLNLSVLDSNFNSYKLADFKKDLESRNKRKIVAKGPMADTSLTVRLIAQRYNLDAEIFSKLINVELGPERRAVPRTLDLFASLGIQTAEDILLNYYKEGQIWKDYPNRLKQVKSQFSSFDFTKNLYSGWIGTLLGLFEKDKNYPYFMQNPLWDYKSLNTSLGSYTNLKHLTVLYAKQSSGAEGGDSDDNDVPFPKRVGYVEPNVAFWKKALSLLDRTKQMFEKYDLLPPKNLIADVRAIGDTLLQISNKELQGVKLNDRDFDYINCIEPTLFICTLDLRNVEYEMVTSKSNDDSDESYVIESDDKLQLATDIYSISDGNSTRYLTAALGKCNNIYVVVEINGAYYLTKGGIYGYYEFMSNDRLTDSEWQEMDLKKEKIDLEGWLKPFMIEKSIEVKCDPFPSSFLESFHGQSND